MRYARLFISRGLPGSGKSTVAREMLAEHLNRLFAEGSEKLSLSLVSRDDFRKMFHGQRLGWASQEALVTRAQEATIRELLTAGSDVFVHDTNLPDSAVARFERIARSVGARVEVVDLRDVPLEECIRRDSIRTGPARVGADVIRKMHDQHLNTSRRTARVARAAAHARARV
jgi:predicted kinase